MTPAQAFRARAARKVATMTPALARAYLAGVDELILLLTGAELTALVRAGAVERLIATFLSDEAIGTAFGRYRAQVQQTAAQGAAYVSGSVPGVGRIPAIAFGSLNPRVTDAMRGLDTTVMSRLAPDVRATARAILERGLADGASPVTTSRALRDLIGLGPTQVEEVANYRAALEAGKVGKALGYEARNRRYDAMVKRGDLTPARIDTMVEAYTKRRIAINAATTARTATMQAFRVGQRNAWDAAIGAGTVDGSRLQRQWMTVMDGRERAEHAAMNGEITGFDEPYSNGDLIIGEGSPWNCRCSDYVHLAGAPTYGVPR